MLPIQPRRKAPGAGWEKWGAPIINQQSVPNPFQQATGRVGGNITTAQQTQPLSAKLGNSFGQPQGKQKANPLASLMSWLPPALRQQFSQIFSKQFGANANSWTQSLPQNMLRQRNRRR